MNKVEYIFSITEELSYKEVHMCISYVEKTILDALRQVDKMVEMSEISKIDAKMSILLSKDIIDGLLEKMKLGNLNGTTDINFTIAQKFNFFEKMEQPA